ncbi:MAG: phosphoenolpyruvate hydrolase family protein [Anaerolineaceae bacterium]|nr:phosphoenolpyruvate hydrolase family protein [Anaerolineaceae bacterium]
MAKRYSRGEVVNGLRAQTQQGQAVLMFGAGTGLTAKCAEQGGADLIGIYSTAIYRMRGQSSLMAWLPYSNANEHLLHMAREILPAVKHTPCVAGIGAHDPELDLEAMFDRILGLGFSGVNNEPFAGLYGPYFANQLERAGIGFSREVEMIRCAHARDIFTVAWVMSPAEATRMAEVGADVVGAMIGVTTGGISGASETLSLEQAAEDAQAMTLAAKQVNPDVIVLTHGGPFSDVETAQYSLDHSDADGYASGSSGERIPTEQAVIEITRRYKSIRVN